MVQMCLCHKDTAVQQAAPYYRKADSSLCAYNLPEKTKKKKPTQSSVTAVAGSHGYFENKDYFDKFEYIGWLGLWGCAN